MGMGKNIVPLFFRTWCFSAPRYASAVYAVVVCPSVCMSVRVLQAGTVPKRLNTGSHK